MKDAPFVSRYRSTPGTKLDASVVLDGETLVAVCDGGHRWTVVPASLGEPCSGCGCPLRRPDHIDEAFAAGRRPWPDEGWGVRVVPATTPTTRGAA